MGTKPRTPLIEPDTTDAPPAAPAGGGNSPAAGPIGDAGDVTAWCHPPALSFAERLAVVSAVMQYGSERDRENPVPAAQQIARGIVGSGWPLADGSDVGLQPLAEETKKNGLE